MTKTEKVIADYILDHLNTIGLQTATSLAYEIGVSDTSIIRFIRTLGFSGYSDFKREMSAQMVKKYHETLSAGEKYIRTRDILDQDNLILDSMGRTIDNIRKSCESLEIGVINCIAELLIQSRRKFIVGFRGTSCCATYMSRKLLLLMPDVFCCDYAESTTIERIVDIGPKDCILLYSFPRYTELNKSLIEIAKRCGAKVIVITDRITSPLASDADLLITASVEGLGVTNSYVVPIFISEIILLAISSKIDISNDHRTELMDEYLDRHKMY